MQFILGDRLPQYYDVAIAIYGVCHSYQSEKMQSCITAYTDAIITLWQKAFGDRHIMARSNVRSKVEEVVKHYNTHVYIEFCRTKPKKKGAPLVKKGMRQLNREWREKHMSVSIHNKKLKISINSLFDIGKDMGSLDGDEEKFYVDQQGPRKGLLSDSIDLKYAKEIEEERARVVETAAWQAEEERYAGEYDEEQACNVSSGQLDVSLNRSGTVRSTKCTENKGVQVSSRHPRPKIRNGRNCTFRSKSACARVSVRCNISAELSREAVRITCESMYDDHFYTSKDEAIEKDPNLKCLRKQPDEEAPRKLSKRDKVKETVPHSLEEWKVYENVLPSSKTINNHKHTLAIQQEKDAATALNNISPGTKVTLHYDSTSRSKIDGDWPALILIFSNNQRFTLRPIFFAYEDRAQIIRLVVETYSRMAATLNNEDNSVTSKVLWEKTTALMTDSVTKNLKIECGVAEVLNSRHIPYHLLCKAHTVEAFDRSNLEVLGTIEKDVSFRAKLEKMNPAVKSFLRGKTSVVEAAMSSILSLVSHDKSAHSTNQADLFDFILQRENKVNTIAMYYERRFTKLGYSAASILQALPYLRMLLNESHLSNQHIEIVKMFLDSEFLITELQVLAYFTHTITLPFLYFVEVNTNEELLTMFPRLFNDLKAGDLKTLIQYRVEYPHVKVNEPEGDVPKTILKKMCTDAANVLERQAGREYGFGEQSANPEPRATQIHLLTKEERHGLPSHNLDAERHLSVFGKRAPVAKFRNKKFTAKGIRNDVTLFQSDTFDNEFNRGFMKVVKLLNEMESNWMNSQKEFHKSKILEKIKKGENQSKYTHKCLMLCKGWKGPVTSVEELQQILKDNPCQREKIVRIELSYYRDTHRADVIGQPEMFKINNISYQDQLLNFCALLADQDPGQSYVSLPSNKEVALCLSTLEEVSAEGTEVEESNIIVVGQYYVTLFVEGNVNTWYVASCEGDNGDGTYDMHQLTRCNKGSNLLWKQPSKVDKCDLFPGSIIDCIIDGEWDVSKERNMTFTLRNHLYICDLVREIADAPNN